VRSKLKRMNDFQV